MAKNAVVKDTTSVTLDAYQKLSDELATCKRSLKLARAETKQYSKQHSQDVTAIARFRKACQRLDDENNRLSEQLRLFLGTDAGTLLEAYDMALVTLRTIAQMRASLRRRPADWYLGHETVTRAEAFFAKVKAIPFDPYAVRPAAGLKEHVRELLTDTPTTTTTEGGNHGE